MTFPKWTRVGVFALMTTAVATAQHHFPLRSGEWTSTIPDTTHPGGSPMTFLFCMNDETWTSAFNNATCSIQNANFTPGGMTYSMSCPGKSFQMTGHGSVTFDGQTHMISKGAFDMTMSGKTTHIENTADFRWKGPTCDPNADMNLKNHHAPPPSK